MPSQRVLAASRKRSQAAIRLLVAVRRAEGPVRTPPLEPPRLPPARMRELVREQAVVVELGAQIALDHTIPHLDADLRWLETAAARVAPKGKVRT